MEYQVIRYRISELLKEIETIKVTHEKEKPTRNGAGRRSFGSRSLRLEEIKHELRNDRRGSVQEVNNSPMISRLQNQLQLQIVPHYPQQCFCHGRTTPTMTAMVAQKLRSTG
jgi:hypothetical protein